MSMVGVPDSETAKENGSCGGGDNMEERDCPRCGESTKSLGNHLRHCNDGDHSE